MLNVLDEFTQECLAIRVARRLKANAWRARWGCLLQAGNVDQALVTD
jgi:hypothetical protein